MTSRRSFIKQVATIGIASGLAPTILFSQKKTQPIRLLVRADDMGKSHDRNMAIIKAHKEGIVTAVSVMPAAPFFNEAVELLKVTPSLSAGLHIIMLDSLMRPVLTPDSVPTLVNPKGFFWETKEELEEANPSLEEMEREIRAQISLARVKGLNFVYIDNHRLAANVDLIVKICEEQKLLYGDYREEKYGFQRIGGLISESWGSQEVPDGSRVSYSKPALTKEQEQLYYDRLGDLKPGNWVTTAHPGFAEPQRADVTRLLCSSKTKEIIRKKNIQLVSYYDLWREEFNLKR